MNQHQAEAIARKLSTSWPATYALSADTWTEHLMSLAVQGAERTAQVLVETSRRAPTVADFLAKYHELATEHFSEKRLHESRDYDQKAIGHEQYMQRLYRHAEAGDRESNEMVSIWEEIMRKQDLKRFGIGSLNA